MRIGIISDIHSNLLAFEACLEALRANAVDAIYDLGDTVLGSLEPAETLDLLIAQGIPSVRGNTDRMLYDPPRDFADSPAFKEMQAALTTTHLEYLAGLPLTRELEGVLMVHGTPSSDETPLLERITPTGVFLEEEAVILEKLSGTNAGLVLCGHTHIARAVQLHDGRLVVNPGSVGMAAYVHDEPCLHVMQSGSPHARCAILTRRNSGWDVQHLAVVYDWNTAARKTLERGRPDRAQWLRTGRAT
jgi:putative phosphoesterase